MAAEQAAVIETCDICGTICGQCGGVAGVTEVIELAGPYRGYHCTACGWLRDEAGYATTAPQGSAGDPLGGCPGCGSAKHFYADRLIECVNGHAESENKFLLAAMIGISAFTCTVCFTSRFRFRELHEH